MCADRNSLDRFSTSPLILPFSTPLSEYICKSQGSNQTPSNSSIQPGGAWSGMGVTVGKYVGVGTSVGAGIAVLAGEG